jgi:hypothetical protein
LDAADADQQSIYMQLLQMQQQQHQYVYNDNRISANSISNVLARFQQSQPSYQPSLASSIALDRDAHRLAYSTLNQEQQYQLLLEQQVRQRQREQSQATAAAAAASSYRATLLRQAGYTNTQNLLPIHLQHSNSMNYSERLNTIGALQASRNTFQQLAQHQHALPQLQSMLTRNVSGPAEFQNLLHLHHHQGLERNRSPTMAVREHLLGRISDPAQYLGRNLPSIRTLDHNDASTGNAGIPRFLPVLLSRNEDIDKLSPHQVLLRKQIEAFQATTDDVTTHTRGRNKPIGLNQVGIRCRHCAHLPVANRQKGSTYFPATILGIYQAAQNMSTAHITCGLCSEMPQETKQEFERLLNLTIASSGAGRPYWADSARQLGLVDSEEGIQFIRSLRMGGR